VQVFDVARKSKRRNENRPAYFVRRLTCFLKNHEIKLFQHVTWLKEPSQMVLSLHLNHLFRSRIRSRFQGVIQHTGCV
jgi:hypothetical protein